MNRPFDDQSSLRIRLESEAIKEILLLCEQRQWYLICSKINQYEIENTPDQGKRKELEAIFGLASKVIEINDPILERAREFETTGVQAFDAMHLACSENEADIFLTVDDKFLKKALKINKLKVKVRNPLKWLEEVLL